MFKNLSDRLSKLVRDLRGQGRLTETNIEDTLREVRMALLEADVALPIVREFIEHVRAKALGQDVIGSLTPGQALIRVVRDELVATLGEANVPLRLAQEPPAVVLMAGLQGSGKTTTVAKLARLLHERERKTVAVVSCDVYRPAAIEQLRVLAAEIGVNCIASDPNETPRAIATRALTQARTAFADVLLVDTAGRLHIDDAMMQEIRELHGLLHPAETLFVMDSMMGQDALRAARAFADALPLTGVVLTKTDGDARGGAALSARQVIGAPIKFIGVGEKVDALEPFHPERMASRILGMGDLLTLIEQAEQKVDREQAEQFANKLRQGKEFDLADFRDQLKQMRNMGGLDALAGMLPGMNQLPEQVKNQVNDREIIRMVAMVDSMTAQERRFPAVIKASRKIRIANGSGTSVQDLNRLLKQFLQMQKVMKKITKKGGLKNLMRGMAARLPRGAPPR